MIQDDQAGFGQWKSLRGSTLLRSAFYNYSLHFSRFLLPLIVMPYLSRILGPEPYGYVFLATSFGLMLSLFVEFGFSLSATRELAKHRDDPERVAQMFADVLSAKLILAGVAITIGVAAATYLERFQQNPLFAYAGIAYALAFGMSPIWYYQAIEKMGVQSTLEIGGQLVATLLVFTSVHTPADALLVPLLQTFGAGIATCGGYAILRRDGPFRIMFLKPTLAGGLRSIRSGWSLFLFRSFVMLYTTANVFLVGMLLPPSQAAFFGVAEKLFSALCGLFAPFAQTFFPRMNYLLANAPRKALHLAKAGFAFLFGVSIVGVIGAWIAAPLGIRILFGNEFEPAASILEILSLSLPFIAVSQILGLQCMLPLRMDKAFNIIVCSGGALNIVAGLFFIPAHGASAIAYARVAAEAFAAASMILYLLRRRADVRRSYVYT